VGRSVFFAPLLRGKKKHYKTPLIEIILIKFLQTKNVANSPHFLFEAKISLLLRYYLGFFKDFSPLKTYTKVSILKISLGRFSGRKAA
jgi:hypothetical protein